MDIKIKNKLVGISLKKIYTFADAIYFLAMEYIFNNKLVQIKDFTLNDYNIYIDIYGESDYVADGYYIIIPDDQPKSVVESEIGFYNNKRKQRDPEGLRLNYVYISKISAVITQYKAEWGSCMESGLYKQYHYKIELKIYSDKYEWNSEVIRKLEYSSKDYFNLDVKNSSKKDYAYTISNLIKIHIPNLQFALANKIPVNDIDFKKYLTEQKVSLKDRIISIFTDLDLTNINSHAFIQINRNKADTWIIYIISKIIGCIPMIDYKNEYYLFEIQDANEYIQYKKNIIVGLITNYNINDNVLFSFIRKDCLKSYIKDKVCYMQCSDNFKEKYRGLFDFIYSIESVSKIEEHYRVGRDDSESTIKSVLFNDITFNPSAKLISNINSALSISLNKINEKYSWKHVESEYVAGLAKSRDYTAEYQKGNISRLERMIIEHSLQDKNWINTISSK